MSCTAGRQSAVDAYQAAAQGATVPPLWEGTGASIEVIDVEYLGRIGADDDFGWSQSFCFEGSGYLDSPLYTQRITLQAVSATGRVIESIEMVKSE